MQKGWATVLSIVDNNVPHVVAAYQHDEKEDAIDEAIRIALTQPTDGEELDAIDIVQHASDVNNHWSYSDSNWSVCVVMLG